MQQKQTADQPNGGASEIDAREAELLGKPQRIEPLSEAQFDAEARTLINRLRKSLGAGEALQIPEVFGVMLRDPGLFRCTMQTGLQLMDKGALLPRERELAILRVGWLCRAPYEWGQHVEIAKRFGVTAEEIERVTGGSAAAGWSEHDKAIIAGVEELLSEQLIRDATWDVLARTWTERQLLEFPVVVGQYFTIALQQNSLRLRLNPNNHGLRHR
jgi:4-carboxymuconolactone decarboxylase